MTWVTCGECVYLCVVMCTLKCLAANARVRVVAFLSSSLHPLPPPTSVLHNGHVVWFSSHRSTHWTWNSCLHGSLRNESPSCASHRHTAQVTSASSEDPSFAQQNVRTGIRRIVSLLAPASLALPVHRCKRSMSQACASNPKSNESVSRL